MREPSSDLQSEADFLIAECSKQGIPVYYSTNVQVSIAYLLDNLLKRIARLENENSKSSNF